ncbi:tol-pal system-associated acyl-CoA thioesterase [Maricaulis maris]|uniref:Acyl-CoA thioester hydrolase n=1 Tax=Maricaulis maris TaxID=74318 RepID=A0A495D066_9PROT|nr:tol-pal system-associated acyl-CoA thioesterase [Maricaulis maris]RKQ94179.1 acyl-CoA thioester hydrolase [Maricaulis maris]
MTNAPLMPAAGAFGDDHVHRLPVRVYYEDTDFSGVVYHACYLHFFERGRTESLRACGIHHSELAAMEPSLAFAVRRMGIEFVRAARVDDVLIVETAFRPQQGARLMMEQRLTREGEVVAIATVQAVCIDGAGRAKRPPQWMRQKWVHYVSEGLQE